MSTKYDEIVQFMKQISNPEAVKGMAHFGIKGGTLLGIQIPVLREIAKKHKNDHALAIELWASGIHEARILASMVDDPKQLTDAQMEKWILEFDSWDVCDQVIMNLFEKHPDAYANALIWCKRKAEYEKRAGFVMMARLAVSDKKLADEIFISFFPHITEGATDDRNMVKKAVNWAIRQIGKRNTRLHPQAIQLSESIMKINSKAARWIASDALRELKNEKTIGRIKY
jgi:3-methyladenine DNA glycosylase AlkD